MVKFADSKINFLLVISGVSTTYILANLKAIVNLGLHSQIFLLIFLLAFLLFIIFALLTIFPRYASNTGLSVPKLIYHHHISEREDAQKYLYDFKEAKEEELFDDILYQVYEVSKITDQKFKFYNISGIFIGIQLVTFVFICIFKIV